MTALAVSPHLDDAAFSAGGTLAALVAAGHDVVVATVFTRSLPAPTGFALACQTDKGIAPDADYLAARRAEDAAACRELGAEAVWLDLPEAPHRGYGSAAALFAGVPPADAGTWRDVAAAVRALVRARRPDVLLSCQGLGGHADHRHTVRAVAFVAGETRVPAAWWRDAPYAIREPEAAPDAGLPNGLAGVVVPLAPADLAAKLDACAAYASQLPFQFARDRPGTGPEAAMRDALAAFAAAEGGGRPAECWLADARATDVLRALANAASDPAP